MNYQEAGVTLEVSFPIKTSSALHHGSWIDREIFITKTANLINSPQKKASLHDTTSNEFSCWPLIGWYLTYNMYTKPPFLMLKMIKIGNLQLISWYVGAKQQKEC